MTFDEFLGFLLEYTVPVLLTLGVLTGVYYLKPLDKVHRILVLYLAVCLSVDLLSRVFAKLYGNNLILIPVSGFLELISFSFFYYHVLKNKRLIPPLVVGALAYILYEASGLNVDDVAGFQTYSRVVASFLITVMSIVCFFEWIGSESQMPGNILLLNASNLIFYAFNLICFLPVNFLINVDSDIKFSFWFANFLVTLVFYIVLTFVIWKNGKSRKQLRPG